MADGKDKIRKELEFLNLDTPARKEKICLDVF
jgi:hypothetical protein